MKFEKPVPKGTKIVTTMRLENSGLLYVEAEEELYHSKLNASFILSVSVKRPSEIITLEGLAKV